MINPKSLSNLKPIKPGQVLNPGGKPKGLKDKITKIKEAICNNFDQSKFKVWSERHESEFYDLMIKVMPKEIDLSGELNFPVININMPGHNDDTKPKR